MRQRALARAFLIPGTLWLLVLFIIPLGLMAAVSLATTDIVGRPVYGLFINNYAQVFQPLYLPVFLRSLGYAVITTAVCIALGYPTAYAVARFAGKYRNLLIILVILPWFVDYLVRIYSWLEILGQDGIVSNLLQFIGVAGHTGANLLGNPYAVIGGLVYNYIPYMILPIYVAVEQMDESLIEAGKDLYGSPASTFFHVTLPTTIQGITAGCVLVFLPAIGDFATAQVPGSPEQYMIGNLISNELLIPGATPLGAGLTVVLVLLLAIVVLTYLRTMRGRSATLAGGEL